MMEPSLDGVSGGTAGNHGGGIDPAKAQVLEALLQELSFWEPPRSAENGVLRKSRSVNDVSYRSDEASANHSRTKLIHATSYGGKGNSSMGNFQHEYLQEPQHSPERNENATTIGDDTPPPASPTLAELQAHCFWNKAIDPSTGRTYYYDIRTRQTQWEKPREIRAIEKRIKKDQRRLDEAFFREMERNLLASLARGECVPATRQPDETGVSTASQSFSMEAPLFIGDTQLVASDARLVAKDDNGRGRVRTISCMNEHLLAQLQQPLQLQRVSSSGISKSFEGRPPLPTRPPLSSSTSTATPGLLPSSINNISSKGIDAHTSDPCNERSHLDIDADDFEKNYYFTVANDDFDDLKLSPEESQRKQQLPGAGPTQDDTLRGEDLLDGALMLADLDVSDEEDGLDIDTPTRSGSLSQSTSGPDIPLGMSRVDVFPSSSGKATNPVTPIVAKSKKVDANGLAPLSHIRRNTAGAVPPNVKGGTMEKPDIDATIHVVCGVIRAHIEQSLHYHNRPTTAPPHTVNINLDVFRDDHEIDSISHPQRKPQKRVSTSALPSLEEIKKFYREFYQRSQMECDAIIMSLIYVERLIKTTNGAVMPTPYNWASVVFSCMILASKVWDDLSMWNVDFSNVSVNSGVLSSFSLKRINELELAILACLNFAVAIPGSEYAKYYYLLRSMMIRGGLLDPFVANQRLSTDTTNRLEDRTTHYQDSILLHSDSENTRRRVRSVDWSALTNVKDQTVPLSDDLLLGKPSQESAKVQ